MSNYFGNFGFGDNDRYKKWLCENDDDDKRTRDCRRKHHHRCEEYYNDDFSPREVCKKFILRLFEKFFGFEPPIEQPAIKSYNSPQEFFNEYGLNESGANSKADINNVIADLKKQRINTVIINEVEYKLVLEPDATKDLDYSDRKNPLLILATADSNDKINLTSGTNNDIIIANGFETVDANDGNDTVYGNNTQNYLGGKGIDNLNVANNFSNSGFNLVNEDIDADGIIDNNYDYTYTSKGQLKKLKVDLGNDGDEDYVTRYRYDNKGNIKREKITFYDENGKKVEQTIKKDTNNDNQFDSIIKKQFDENGNIETIKVYDSNNRLIKEIINQDIDDNGTIDNKIINEYKYDDAIGKQIHMSHQENVGNNGKIDYSSTYDYEYDENGNKVRQTFKEDKDNDGVIDALHIDEYKYDADNNKISKTYLEDTDHDGNINYKQVEEFDANGNVIKTTKSFDDDDNGIFDRVEEYDENGQKKLK